MQSCEFGIALIGVGGTLLGTILGYFLSSKIAKIQALHAENLAVINARRIAGAKLRAAFAHEIGQVEILGIAENWFEVDSALKSALPKQSAAIQEYRWFVPPERQEEYQQAWEDYCEIFERNKDSFFSICTAEGLQLFGERVLAILKFTEPN